MTGPGTPLRSSLPSSSSLRAGNCTPSRYLPTWAGKRFLKKSTLLRLLLLFLVAWRGDSTARRATPTSALRSSEKFGLELAPIGIEPSCNADTDARSCGEFSKLPVSKEPLRARTPTIHHRTHLGTVRSPPAREGDRPSARLPPAPHSRSRGFREARCGSGLRLRLLEDRRREVFGNHDEAKARRVGGGRSDGLAGGDRFAILRADDRPRAFRRVGRRVHYESSVRRRQIGHKPGRQGKAGHQTLDDGGRERHTSGGGRGGSQSPRFAASLSHPRRRRRQADGKAAVELPEQAGVHLDRAYASRKTRQLLEERGLVGVIAKKGVPAPLVAGLRWVVERTNSWHNAHKKLVWCTEREDRVIDFWIALSNVVIVVRRLIREGWVRYRWEGRPSRKP